MRTDLLPWEIEFYRLMGFVVIPDFLNNDELHLWRNRADAEVAAQPPPPPERFSIRSRNMSGRDPEWAKLLFDPAIAKMAGELAGVPAVRYAGDMISYSDPGCPPSPWHCSTMEGGICNTRLGVALQVELDDNTVMNKAMCFLPGTQDVSPFDVDRGQIHTPEFLARRSFFGQIFDDFPEWRRITPVAAECPAGSALFYNPAGVHGSAPNMTNMVRRYVGIQYLPSDAVYNGRPGEYVSHLQRGDLLDVPEMPVLWPPA